MYIAVEESIICIFSIYLILANLCTRVYTLGVYKGNGLSGHQYVQFLQKIKKTSRSHVV